MIITILIHSAADGKYQRSSNYQYADKNLFKGKQKL